MASVSGEGTSLERGATAANVQGCATAHPVATLSVSLPTSIRHSQSTGPAASQSHSDSRNLSRNRDVMSLAFIDNPAGNFVQATDESDPNAARDTPTATPSLHTPPPRDLADTIMDATVIFGYCDDSRHAMFEYNNGSLELYYSVYTATNKSFQPLLESDPLFQPLLRRWLWSCIHDEDYYIMFKIMLELPNLCLHRETCPTQIPYQTADNTLRSERGWGLRTSKPDPACGICEMKAHLCIRPIKLRAEDEVIHLGVFPLARARGREGGDRDNLGCWVKSRPMS